MTSSMGINTAVSAYELLNRKINHRTTMEKHPSYNSEDEDFLPLKPKKPAQVITNKSEPFHDMVNMNNSNVSEPEKPGYDAIGQSKLFDDIEQSLNLIPVPFAWSPGMIITSNPSLFITPQKCSASKELYLPVKDNTLEPESENKIPKPVAWSPGMKVQLDPNLFITPEKCNEKKITTTILGDKTDNITKNSNLSKKSFPTKTKEAYSVRFDLPSSTSGDETAGSMSETDSPITLKGCEISTERQHFESPVWKTFSPQRTYNPNAYSDESSLEDSITNSLPTTKKDPSYDNLKTCVTGSVSDISRAEPNMFSKLPATTSKVSSSQSQHLAVGKKKGAKYSISILKPSKIDNSKSNIPVTAKPKAQNDMKWVEKSTAKGEPHFISAPSSQCESPSESAVIREMKDNLLSTEYSFPFKLRAATEDSEYEHVFTRPEFNSTLKVRAELNTLYEQEVDVTTAVSASLAKSEVKRLEMNEKAAAYTNRMSSQFNNLIDLNTSVETLCDRIVRMRTNKVVSKKRGTHLDKKLTAPDRTPDLLEFFTSDLQKEFPDLTLPGVAHVTSKLMTAPPEIAFDLYRHNRIWQGINDF